MAVDFMADGRAMTRRFVREDAPSCGGVQPALRSVARVVGVTFSTLRGIYEGRTKKMQADIFAKLKTEEMKRLNRAIARAENDMAVARALGLRPDSPAYSQAEASVMAARKILGG